MCSGNVAPRLPAEPPLTRHLAGMPTCAVAINIARTLPDAGWHALTLLTDTWSGTSSCLAFAKLAALKGPRHEPKR